MQTLLVLLLFIFWRPFRNYCFIVWGILGAVLVPRFLYLIWEGTPSWLANLFLTKEQMAEYTAAMLPNWIGYVSLALIVFHILFVIACFKAGTFLATCKV